MTFVVLCILFLGLCQDLEQVHCGLTADIEIRAKNTEIGYFIKYDNFVILEYVEMLVYNERDSSMTR